MFAFRVFAAILILGGAATTDGKRSSEGGKPRKDDAENGSLWKSGRGLRIPQPTHQIFTAASPSYDQQQIKQLPQQTIYYHGPIGKSKFQIQRFREFAAKNRHHVKKSGASSEYEQREQPFSYSLEGVHNQPNTIHIRETANNQFIGDDMETNNPIKQFVYDERSTEKPLAGQIQSESKVEGTPTQNGYPVNLFGNGQPQNYYSQESGIPSQTEGRNSPSNHLGYHQTSSGNVQYVSGSQSLRGPQQGSQSHIEYPQNQFQSGFSHSQSENPSPTAYPQRPGIGQYQTGYFSQAVENGGNLYSQSVQGGYPRPTGGDQMTQSELTRPQLIQGNYSQKPVRGGSQTGHSQIYGSQPQGGSTQLQASQNQIKKPNVGQYGSSNQQQNQAANFGKPSTGFSSQYGSQQQFGNQFQDGSKKKPGPGQYGSNQQSAGNQYQNEYPQKPIASSTTNQQQPQVGRPQRPGNFQQQGTYLQKPSGESPPLQYPQKPINNLYGSNQLIYGNRNPTKGGSHSQKPAAEQSQSIGFPQQSGYPHRPGNGGQRPPAGIHQQTTGRTPQGETGYYTGNETGQQGDGNGYGSPFVTGEAGLTTNDRLRKYCREPRGQFASESCNKFVNCWDDVVVEQECGGTLVFNELKRYCDYPENVDCGGRITSVTSDSNDGTEGDQECPSSFATYRSAHDCGEFIVCAHGIAHKFHCAGGLAYNYTLGVCDYPRNVNCSGIPLLPYPEDQSETERETDEPESVTGTNLTSESDHSEGLWNYRQAKANKLKETGGDHDE